MPLNMPQRIAFGVTEAALMMGVSRDSVVAAIKRGELPARRLAHKYLISAQALENYLQGE